MQKITNFIKYNNAFVVILGFLFLAAGSSFASEKVRDAVVGQTIEETKGIDNSALLSADLNSLKQDMKIDDVSEDEENYYVVYSFSTFDVKDNVWKNIVKNQTLKVPKEALIGGKDLGIHVQSELSQVLDSHLAYLKDAQDKERKKGATKIVKTIKYTGLKGLVLNSETKELDGYEPVIKKENREVVQSNFAGASRAIELPSVLSSGSSYLSSASENLPSSSVISSSSSSSSAELSSFSAENTASSSSEIISSSVPLETSSSTQSLLLENSSSSTGGSSSASSETASSSSSSADISFPPSSSSSEAISSSAESSSSSETSSSSVLPEASSSPSSVAN